MNFLLPASSAPRPPVLRRRYFWFLGGFVTVLLLVTSVPEAYFAFRENRARIAELQSAEARLAASRVTSFLEYHERLLTEVDGLPWRSGVLDEADRVAEYERLMKLVPAVMQIEHIDVAGKRAMRISRTDPNLVGTAPTAAALTAAQQARRTGKWYSPTYLREGNVPYVTLALAAGEGRNGASVVQINLRFVTDMVAQMRFGVAGQAYIVDSASKLVAHPNLSLVLRGIDLGGKLPAALLAGLTAIEPDSQSQPGMAFFESEAIEGGRVLSSAVRIEAPGWWVVVEQPYSEALSSVFGTLRRTAGFLLLGLGLAFVASYLLARTFSAPILRLQRGAARIGAGDLSARIDVQSGDEIEALANEFNKMAAQLEEYTTGLEKMVSQKTAQLEQANRHKSEFLTNMSHELRTPLNAIIGFNELVSRGKAGPISDQQKEFLNDSLNSARHLLQLINDVLDLAKVEAGKMDFRPQSVDLEQLIGEVRDVLRGLATSKKLRIECSVDPLVSPVVVDSARVKQVLYNFLSNAIKFTNEGGTITIRVQRETATHFRLDVEDTGIGIAPEDTHKLFIEFQQLDAGHGKRYAGTGLGLALTKRIVEGHQGRVEVASTLGKGSTFSAILPRHCQWEDNDGG